MQTNPYTKQVGELLIQTGEMLEELAGFTETLQAPAIVAAQISTGLSMLSVAVLSVSHELAGIRELLQNKPST